MLKSDSADVACKVRVAAYGGLQREVKAGTIVSNHRGPPGFFASFACSSDSHDRFAYFRLTYGTVDTESPAFVIGTLALTSMVLVRAPLNRHYSFKLMIKLNRGCSLEFIPILAAS